MRWRGVCVVISLLLAACGSDGKSSSSSSTRLRASTTSTLGTTSTSLSPASAGPLNAFAFSLLHANVGTAKGNVAVSPWSIATALGMARLGAKGRTATEMDTVQPATAAALKALNSELASRNGTFGDLAVEITAANRAFAQKDLKVEQAYLDALRDNFASTLGLVDYKTATEAARTEINKWVGDQTHDRIKELLQQGVLDAMTRLVLVNAVYVKADWATPFEKDATAPATFNAPGGEVQASFMHSTDSHRFASGDGWRAVELTYAGGKLAMVVVVPDAGRFDAVASGLTPAAFSGLDGATPDAVDLALPKFDFAKALELKDQLVALGMPTAFSDAADFSGMTTQEQLQIADVVHQANITVDEKGTVAAAATAVNMRATSARIAPQKLVVDRPFLFFLRDRPTGAILFAGQVTDPTKK